MGQSDVGIRSLPEIQAGGFSRMDSTIQFYERINALLESDFVVLDFGAGRGAGHCEDHVRYRRELRNLKGKVCEVIGADIDPIVTTNPSLDRAIVLEPGGDIPLADRSVQMVVSDFTFEHIENPAHVAREIDRILAPGGWICVRTPNRNGYVSLANRIFPDSIRSRMVSWTQPDRKKQDVFKAFYRLNTLGAIRKYFDSSRYAHYGYSWDAEPAYHANSEALYRLFLTVHALTPPALRTLLLIFLQKKHVPSTF